MFAVVSRDAAMGAWSDAEHESTQKELDAEMSAALKAASAFGSLQDGDLPPLATMFEDVYREMPAHLQSQMRDASQALTHAKES